MIMPNFLIIGAGRSGTTSLYYYLKQHPEIYMSPIKEPRFFIYEGQDPASINHPFPKNLITTLEDYQALFAGVTNEKAFGEASVEYFYRPQACERIKYYLPNVKLIAGLRNPIDRVFSHFTLMVREGIEKNKSFSKALEADLTGKNPKTKYLGAGFYSNNLKRYLDNFDRDKIFIYLYEDFAANPSAVTKEIFEFLEVTTEFNPETNKKYNEGKIAKPNNILFKNIQKKLNKVPLVKKALASVIPNKLQQSLKSNPSNSYETLLLDPATKEKLIEIYKEDVLQLQQLIGKDLSHWLM